MNDESQSVKVDAYAGDNSFYSTGTDSITYSTGGVDDAENAEVILHEYGHSIDGPVSKFRAGAKAIIAADTSLYGGTHVAKITRIFERRGIL